MEIKHKIRTSFKSLVSKSGRAWRLKSPQVINKLYEKQCLPLITWNKKHLSKQIVTIAYTLKKKFSAVATFEGLGGRSQTFSAVATFEGLEGRSFLDRVKKTFSILDLHDASLDFQRR